MFNKRMFTPQDAYRFVVEFQFREDISEDYLRYLTSSVTKTRINQVKKTVEIWFRHNQEGPIHDLVGWFTVLEPTIRIKELTATGEVNRILDFSSCSLADHELMFNYSEASSAQNYTLWSYKEATL